MSTKIRILIPGKSYTQGFMRGLLDLTNQLTESSINATIHNFYGPYLPEVRNVLLLGGHPATGNRAPFNGDYDYIMWIETDIVFTAEDFFTLYKNARNNDLDFVTGLFPMGPQHEAWEQHAVAGTWKGGRLRIEGSGLEEIDYCGVGFLLVRKGVYEALRYPWYGMGEIYHFDEEKSLWYYMGDDFSTASRIQEMGFKLYADRDVKLGHEKMKVAGR